MTIRNFEPGAVWADKEGLLTERAKGYLRGLFDYIGATAGSVPVLSLGGDGVSTTTFLREDGTWNVPVPAASLVITWTGLHTFSAGAAISTLTTTASATIGTGFGCNSKSAQTAVTAGAAVVGTAATNVVPYGYATAAQADDIVTRINTIRAALIANGICV